MKLWQDFDKYTGWGKLIGAIVGYLTFGAVGGLFGLLIGNFLDIGMALQRSRPFPAYDAEKNKSIQKLFFETTFSVMGYIAKADGRVSRQEIQIAETIMNEMKLKTAARAEAQAYFNQGKKANFHLDQKISQLFYVLHNKPELLKLFIDIQYRAAKVDGLSLEKQRALNTVLTYLGFADLPHQHRFYEDFAEETPYYYQQQSSSKNACHQHPKSQLDHAYSILGVDPTANQQDIKRAYRRLISQNHPDKLIAKKFSEEKIRAANEKTQTIRKAYEYIVESKGW